MPTFPATPTNGVAAPGQPGSAPDDDVAASSWEPIKVYNNSTIADLATAAADDFRNAGFQVDEVGNYPFGLGNESTVYYRPGTPEQATAEALGARFGCG